MGVHKERTIKQDEPKHNEVITLRVLQPLEEESVLSVKDTTNKSGHDKKVTTPLMTYNIRSTLPDTIHTPVDIGKRNVVVLQVSRDISGLTTRYTDTQRIT